MQRSKRVPNPPRRCIFCGRLGVTNEHMYADWLRNYIPRELTRHDVAFERVALVTSEKTIERREGDPHSRRIKCVCRECNNGWMSVLQDRTKPHLVPMLHGQPTTLRRNGQTLMAAWAAMMVMVGEHLNQQLVAIPAADRRWLKDNMRPPSHFRIWIGRHAAKGHPLFTHNVMSFVPEKEIQRLGPEAAEASNTQTSTVLVGKHLLIHVMSSVPARSLIRRWRNPPDLAQSLVQIWPRTSIAVTWPPPAGVALHDTAIDFLAQHFFRASYSLARQRGAFFE